MKMDHEMNREPNSHHFQFIAWDERYRDLCEQFVLNPGGSVDEDRAFAFDTAGMTQRAGVTDLTQPWNH